MFHVCRYGDGSDPLYYNLSERLPEGQEDTRRPKGIHPFALLASALDPRFKFLKGISAGSKNKHHLALWGRLIDAITDQMYSNEESEGNDGGGGGHIDDVVVLDDDEDEDDDSPFGSLSAVGPQISGPLSARAETNEQRKSRCHAAAVREVTLYKKEPKLSFYMPKLNAAAQAEGGEEEEREFSDPLLWWKVRAVRFPLLAQLARRLLAIPASSAPSERLFSESGQLVSQKRASLHPDTVEDIMLLRGSWDATEEHVAKNKKG
jgi:hypothetical protein